MRRVLGTVLLGGARADHVERADAVFTVDTAITGSVHEQQGIPPWAMALGAPGVLACGPGAGRRLRRRRSSR